MPVLNRDLHRDAGVAAKHVDHLNTGAVGALLWIFVIPKVTDRLERPILSRPVILPVMLERFAFAAVKVHSPEIEKSQLRRIADDHFYIRRVLGYCPPPFSKTAMLIDGPHPFI